ncbi:MAG TPA: hypothetical protein VF710_01820, partial [Longimicrobium sp.]
RPARSVVARGGGGRKGTKEERGGSQAAPLLFGTLAPAAPAGYNRARRPRGRARLDSTSHSR